MTTPADQPGPEPTPRGLERLKEEGKRQHPVVVRNVDDALRLGEIFVRSGFFQDAKAVSQAVVKILYGVELGLGPMAAMTGIEIVEGRVTPGANLTASMLEEHPDYDYRVDERTSERCTITFLRRDPETRAMLERGSITWTLEDAKRARLWREDLNPKAAWKAYPRAMLYARAMTEGARTYCPNLFSGITAYSAEELGVEWSDESAEVQAAEAAARGEAAEREAEEAARAAHAVAGEPEPADGTAEEGTIEEPEAGDAGDGGEDPPDATAVPADPDPDPDPDPDGGGGSETAQEPPAEAEVQNPAAPAEEPHAPAEAAQTPESAQEENAGRLTALTRQATLFALGIPGPRVAELRAIFECEDLLDLLDDDAYHPLLEAVRAEASALAAGGNAT